MQGSLSTKLLLSYLGIHMGSIQYNGHHTHTSSKLSLNWVLLLQVSLKPPQLLMRICISIRLVSQLETKDYKIFLTLISLDCPNCPINFNTGLRRMCENYYYYYLLLLYLYLTRYIRLRSENLFFVGALDRIAAFQCFIHANIKNFHFTIRC